MSGTKNNELCPFCHEECFDKFIKEQAPYEDEFDGDSFGDCAFEFDGVCPHCGVEIVVSFETTDYAIDESSISIERVIEVMK